MKFLLCLFAIMIFSTQLHAGNALNCHTDAAQTGTEEFTSFDMSLSVNDSFIVKKSGKLYINTFPPHPVEPNPFLKVKTEKITVNDSLIGADGQIILYFSAGEYNYVLDVEKERADKYVGVMRRHGQRLNVEARCYLFPTLP